MRKALDVEFESFGGQMVYPYGQVISQTSFVTVKLACELDVTQFPFDKQYCPITFSPISFTQSFLIG